MAALLHCLDYVLHVKIVNDQIASTVIVTEKKNGSQYKSSVYMGFNYK